MRKLAVLAGGIAIAAAACSSGPTTTSGTEMITGTTTGSAAAANLNNPNQNAPVVFTTFAYTGPASVTVKNYTLPGGQTKVGQPQSGVLKTPAGNLALTHTATYQPSNTTPPTLLKTIPAGGSVGAVCVFTIPFEKGNYTVNGSQSTGKFHGATGHGTYVITATIGAKLPAGKTTCNINDFGANGPKAIAQGSSILFKATGPLTVSS
jgi:hypothetical protein